MDLIYTNTEKEDVGVLKDFSLDLAFGADENDFELTVCQENNVAEAGCYIYIQGTEYGGLIDAIKSDNSGKEITYSGRTWHGILNSKILEPDAGEDYLIVSGDANTVLASLIARMGLTSLFTVDPNTSVITINDYQFNRYISGYDGICKMLSSEDAKLHMEHNGTNVSLSAVPIMDYTQTGVDSDQMIMTVKKTTNKVNHLICLGTAQLSERTVIHLYADENGNISQKQTFTSIDEYTAVYDYSNVESTEELIAGGTERLKELLQQDELSVDCTANDDLYDVGDLVGATDNVTGISISVPVIKKVVRIDGESITVDIVTNTVSSGLTGSGQSGSAIQDIQKNTLDFTAILSDGSETVFRLYGCEVAAT